MSNPYTSPDIGGYNSNPPADDGSVTDANALKWQTHLDKIGNPLKTYAEAIDSAVTTAFDRTFGQTYVAKTSSYTVTTADRGKTIVASSSSNQTTVITLPAAATAGDGFPIVIMCQGASSFVQIEGNASELVSGVTTIDLVDGQAAILTCNGTAWYGPVFPEKPTLSVVKTADESKASDTTVADDDTLSISIMKNRRCRLLAEIAYTQNVGDFRFFFQFNSTPATAFFGQYTARDETGTVARGKVNTAGVDSITTMTDGEDVLLTIEGHLLSHATLNNQVDFQWAQNTSSANNTTVYENSNLRLEYLD